MDYLELLNPQQREAVVHSGSPLLILAGAGSGKTRVITTKIAWLINEKNINPGRILAVTFTKKAAGEMKERASALCKGAEGCQIKTFHSFGAWFLRLYGEYGGIQPNFTVYDEDDMKTLVAKANPSLTRLQAAHFSRCISLCKDYGLVPQSGSALETIDSDPLLPVVYENYEKRLRETGNVDFGDLILLPYLILKNTPSLREKIHDKFQVIMVDEYQDSNIAQFMLLQMLCGENSYLCVVGDDDQSIYKFRGAEVQNILSFKDKFPGTKIVRLESNYRSTEEILQVAGDVVSNNSSRLGKNLRSQKGSGKLPVLAFLPNQEEEVKFCGDLIIESKKRGVPYSDWAVLYRTNAQSLGFETEFLHRKIPYAIMGSLKFYEREEIKDILAYLALIANPRDEIAFRRIINKPARGIGNTTQDKIVEKFRSSYALGVENVSYVEVCREMTSSFSKKTRQGMECFLEGMDAFRNFIDINTKNSGENRKLVLSGALEKNEETVHDVEKLNGLIDLIATKSGLKELYQSEDEISGSHRIANIQELSNSAVLYEGTEGGLLEFLDHIELDRTLENADDEKDDDRVKLITLHNTKGLEFNRVIMTGMEWGVFPRQDKTGDDLEEERRLCYVGITRAKDELYMTSCQMRMMYGRTEYMSPSPFLKEISREHIKILGHIPYGFSSESGTSRHGDYGKYGLSHPDKELDEVCRKYAYGTKVYHDDYGYGFINKAELTPEDEYVVSVQFESGGTKKFLPQYMRSVLTVIRD